MANTGTLREGKERDGTGREPARSRRNMNPPFRPVLSKYQPMGTSPVVLSPILIPSHPVLPSYLLPVNDDNIGYPWSSSSFVFIGSCLLLVCCSGEHFLLPEAQQVQDGNAHPDGPTGQGII